MKGAAGFTLLELLVALVVFGLLIAGLHQGLQFGFRALAAQSAAEDAVSGLDAVDRALRQLIAGMSPGADEGPPPFVGARQEMRFVAHLPGSGAEEGLNARVTLRFAADHRLMLAWTPFAHVTWIRGVPAGGQQALLDGVASAEFSFRGQSGAWSQAWNNPDRPALVRVRLRFPPGDPRHWPDIVVAPLLVRP